VEGVEKVHIFTIFIFQLTAQWFEVGEGEMIAPAIAGEESPNSAGQRGS
jgi:hypothetical protein